MIEKIYLRLEGNKVYTDSLTRVKSRVYYDEVAKIKYQPKSINVIFVDINNLKSINDTYGHNVGSELVRNVAVALINKYPNCDICRIGGDEFVIFTEDKHIDEDLRLDERISTGSYFKEIYEDVSSAVAKADAIMYKNKKLSKAL